MIITAVDLTGDYVNGNILHVTDGNRIHEWYDLRRLVTWQLVDAAPQVDGTPLPRLSMSFDGFGRIVELKAPAAVLDEILEHVAVFVSRPSFSRQLEQISEQLDSIGQQIQGFA